MQKKNSELQKFQKVITESGPWAAGLLSNTLRQQLKFQSTAVQEPFEIWILFIVNPFRSD